MDFNGPEATVVGHHQSTAMTRLDEPGINDDVTNSTRLFSVSVFATLNDLLFLLSYVCTYKSIFHSSGGIYGI